MSAQHLDPITAANYQLLVDSGDRTWAQIADMADAHDSPDLAAYARQRAARDLPRAPVIEKPAPTPEKTAAPDTGR